MDEDSSTYPTSAGVKQEAELAKVSALLALTISVAVMISNFGSMPKEITLAQEQVVVHRRILREHADLLQQNQSVLSQNQALLAARHAPNPISK